MNCNEASRLVDAYADREIAGLRRYAVKRHLEGCPSCAARHHRVLALRERVRDELPYYPASPELRARVGAAVAAMRATESEPRRPPWRWLAGGALAGSAATILAWMLGTAILVAQADDHLAAEAVAMHVKATLSKPTIEVVSSDRHTVKPWLSARLAYSPPVQDFAGDGFPLVGGRIDAIDGRPIATLVYRHRAHTIDVFVRPSSGDPLPDAPRNVRGFNVAFAKGSGMDWVAVSDVNVDELRTLVQRLASLDPAR